MWRAVFKINRSLTCAYRVADIIQRRSGDTATRHIPGQDIEKEHMKSRNRQLRDLDSENRQLRQLYEDSQWTLHLVMEAHRRASLNASFGRDDDLESLREDEADGSLRRNFNASAAQMTKEIYDFFEHKNKINVDIHKRLEELKAENDLLRRVLEFESGVNIQTIVDCLKSRIAKISLISSKSSFEGSLGRQQPSE